MRSGTRTMSKKSERLRTRSEARSVGRHTTLRWANPAQSYRIALRFEKWGDRDAWQGPREVLLEAFGEQEGAKIYTQGTAQVAHSSSRIWEVIDDGTANPQTAGAGSAPFYEVTIRWVKPEMVDEYRGLLRRFKTAYEGAEGNPSVTRWVLRFGSQENMTFRRTQPFDSWGDRDSWNARDVISKQFGADAPLLFARLNAAVSKSEHFVSAYRPDLSRTAASTSSD